MTNMFNTFGMFKEIDEQAQFELVENGFVLRLSGRDAKDDYVNKSFIYATKEDFFEALSDLVEERK